MWWGVGGLGGTGLSCGEARSHWGSITPSPPPTPPTPTHPRWPEMQVRVVVTSPHPALPGRAVIRRPGAVGQADRDRCRSITPAACRTKWRRVTWHANRGGNEATGVNGREGGGTTTPLLPHTTPTDPLKPPPPSNIPAPPPPSSNVRGPAHPY